MLHAESPRPQAVFYDEPHRGISLRGHDTGARARAASDTGRPGGPPRRRGSGRDSRHPRAVEPVHHHRAGADATVEVGAAAPTDRTVHHAEALAFHRRPRRSCRRRGLLVKEDR
ncbi:hypothetical protein ACFVZ3_08380 [Kitasatospora purpeofusca]|uniref:hypothetical protein n=1 Tax=Kitasatospora purpeofusca TaxID=67352 RepID=UPI0036C0CB12